jgi:PKD repeat protein
VKHFPVYRLTCVLAIVMVALGVAATTIVMPTDAQLVAKSPVIVTGTVVRSQPVDRNGAIWTETVIAVDGSLKGNITGEVTVREIGGELGDRITKVFGVPQYTEGERVLAFLTPSRRGDYQTTDLFVGKFSEQTTVAGERLWNRDDLAADATLLDSDFKPIHARNVQRLAGSFEQFVRQRVAGEEGTANYGIENPVLERDIRLASPAVSSLAITSNFTLISEPTVYRWAVFDNGGSAKWYSYGSQTGYTGGGINEISTAMSVWSSYSAAKISYTYAGTTTNIAGLSQPNGVNEILFNDPLGEISGSFNPATGGVVGEGGFNGVTDGGSWTSPFAADPSHPQQTYHVYDIVEGNLTIQDNVSPANGVSSSMLAEIVAHEFGHTLGFGHSTDPTALMYPNITPGGPSLRTDDQLAARWLYPSGQSSPPTVPTAPSGLTVTPSGSTLTLRWTDNATNETGDYIYLAAGGGFSRVASAAAGATSVTLSGLAAATYRVYVTAYNAAGESAASNTATASIAGSGSAPAAAFMVSPPSGTAGQTDFIFTDQSTGSPTSRVWNFGDGATATASSVGHVYANAGQYNVTLTVTNGSGSSQASHIVSVSQPVYRTLISAAAQTNGAGGSVWRTELTLFNAGNEGASVQFVFLPSAGGAVLARSTYVAPMQTLTYNNALLDIYGMSSGAGAITIEATSPTSTPSLKISSRTFTTGSSGTYGQAVPSVTSDALHMQQVLTGIESDAAYRTNIGLVNRSGAPLTASLTLFTSDGRSLGTTSATVPANTFQQTALTSLWSSVSGGSYDRLTLTITSSAANALSTYASVIDNRTQDPIYIQAVPLASGTGQTTLPAVGRAPGANGTYWRSDVTLYNSRPSNADVYLRYLASGADNRNATSRRYTLPAGQTLVIADILSSFGISSGTGALQILWQDGGVGPVVTSRTYTTTAAGGTYGQSIDPIGSMGYDSVVPGLRSDNAYRSNIGFVNVSDSTINVGVLLLSPDGQELGAASVTLLPRSQTQTALAALFPGINGQTFASCTLQAHTNDAPGLFAYGSIVDNGSGDPVFFAGQ